MQLSAAQPAARGLDEIVGRCMDSLQVSGIAKCHLMVIKDNFQGQQFWERMGWQ